MSFASRYNRGSKFDVNTDGFKYLNLQQLQDPNDLEKVFVLRGLYINRKSRYGDAPVAILSDCFVNLPAHLVPDVRDMLSDPDIIQDIKEGRCGFKIEEYNDKHYNQHCYGVRWIDV